eukprot:2140169-Rhodomonas_salina.2
MSRVRSRVGSRDLERLVTPEAREHPKCARSSWYRTASAQYCLLYCSRTRYYLSYRSLTQYYLSYCSLTQYVLSIAPPGTVPFIAVAQHCCAVAQYRTSRGRMRLISQCDLRQQWRGTTRPIMAGESLAPRASKSCTLPTAAKRRSEGLRQRRDTVKRRCEEASWRK